MNNSFRRMFSADGTLETTKKFTVDRSSTYAVRHRKSNFLQLAQRLNYPIAAGYIHKAGGQVVWLK